MLYRVLFIGATNHFGYPVKLTMQKGQYSLDAHYSIRNIRSYKGTPTNIKFPVFEIGSNIDLTDVLNYEASAGKFEIFSKRFIDFIGNHKVYPFEIHNLSIYYGCSKIATHKIFRFMKRLSEDNLDWGKSEFYITNSLNDNNSNFISQEIQFANFEEYVALKNELKKIGKKFIKRKKLFLYNGFNLDFFRGNDFITGVICSSKFKKGCEDLGIDGLKFEPLKLDWSDQFSEA